MCGVPEVFVLCPGALSQAQKLTPNQTTVDDKIRAKLRGASGGKVNGTRQESVTSESDDDEGSDDSEALPGETWCYIAAVSI